VMSIFGEIKSVLSNIIPIATAWNVLN